MYVWMNKMLQNLTEIDTFENVDLIQDSVFLGH